MRNIFSAAVVAASLAVAAAPVSAGTLVVDTGWQDDTLDSAGSPTEQSPWTFTITGSAVLSIVDCCVPGDLYRITGDVSGVSTFYAGSATDIQATGSYGSYWTSADYSKIAWNVGPGTYTFSITGDGAGGTPAGLGVRLDSAGAVPEPASWALMLGGFGLVGGAMRSRRTTAVRFA